MSRERDISKHHFGVVPPFVRSENNYDRNAASDESALSCPEDTLTQQQHREECDINTIVRRFGLTGGLPVSARMPAYGDFTGISDYREAIHAVHQAEESFMAMPADVRRRFNNDPAEFVDFCVNDANREEAEALGLVAAEKVRKAPQKPQEPDKEPSKA